MESFQQASSSSSPSFSSNQQYTDFSTHPSPTFVPTNNLAPATTRSTVRTRLKSTIDRPLSSDLYIDLSAISPRSTPPGKATIEHPSGDETFIPQPGGIYDLPTPDLLELPSPSNPYALLHLSYPSPSPPSSSCSHSGTGTSASGSVSGKDELWYRYFSCDISDIWNSITSSLRSLALTRSRLRARSSSGCGRSWSKGESKSISNSNWIPSLFSPSLKQRGTTQHNKYNSRTRIMRRTWSPTPLGYIAVFGLVLVVLYVLSPGSDLDLSAEARAGPIPPKPTGAGAEMSLPTLKESDESINPVETPDIDLIHGGTHTNADADIAMKEMDNPTLPLLPSIYSAIFPSLTLPSSLLTPELFPLAIKLSEFLHRPILSHDGGAEGNYLGCPRELSDKLVNPDQYNGDNQFWRETVDESEIAKRRSDVVHWLTRRLNDGEQVLGKEGKTGEGRGIVLTGGNQDTTLRTITVLKHLRRLNVDLPIEVFHYSDELKDDNQRREIESLGAQLREAKGLTKDDGAWKNWQIKGLALVQSSFREVLYLDSDNVPLRSPAHLFDAPIYRDNGRAAFWPDLSKDHPDNAIWRIIGEPCSLDLWTFESGQIVIDKAGNDGLNLAALVIAAGMMEDREFWFKMCGGDKDTFRWAFRALGIEFGVSPRWMSALGIRNGYEGDRFCGHSVLQYDLITPPGFTRPPPLFVHSNLLKHLGGSGLGRGSLFAQIRRISNDYSSNPALNYAHSWVYTGTARGMCLDLAWHDTVPDQIRSDEWVETIGVEEEEGDVFAGFEDAWFDEGGRIGGW